MGFGGKLLPMGFGGKSLRPVFGGNSGNDFSGKGGNWLVCTPSLDDGCCGNTTDFGGISGE